MQVLLVLLFSCFAFGQVVPSEWDWRDKGVVPNVTNQGMVGGAYHYAAIQAMESAWKIKTGKTVVLSLQNLIDCASPDDPSLAGDIEYVINNKGIDTEEAYPTTGQRGECRYDPKGKGAYFSSAVEVKEGNENLLAKVVANTGPVAVNVDSSSWQLYTTGIDSSPCGNVNHAALVVGYTPDYWIVQNSWGESWGMGGFIHVARNQGNVNCIATEGFALK